MSSCCIRHVPSAASGLRGLNALMRFVVGARAGQTLAVSIDTDKASLRLLEEADVKFGINNFLVRLPNTGDYTIEVQNNSDSALTLTVNVRIR